MQEERHMTKLYLGITDKTEGSTLHFTHLKTIRKDFSGCAFLFINLFTDTLNRPDFKALNTGIICN
jgi:hypothetical protein